MLDDIVRRHLTRKAMLKIIELADSGHGTNALSPYMGEVTEIQEGYRMEFQQDFVAARPDI